MARSLLALLTLLLSAPSALAQQPIWESAGGPQTGGVDDLVATSTGTLLATASGDLYRSQDHGTSWHRLSSAPKGVRRLVVSTEDIVFAWSGTVWFAGKTGQGPVYASADQGTTWKLVDIRTRTRFVYDIVVGAEGRAFANTSYGVFYSHDGGLSWQMSSWMEVAPDSGRVAAIGANAHGHVAVLDNAGTTLSFSSDNGETWTIRPVSADLFRLSLLWIDTRGRLVGAVQGRNAFFVSADRGTTWRPLAVPMCPDIRSCTSWAVELIHDTLHVSLDAHRERTSQGLYRTPDPFADTPTWTPLGLAGLPVTGVAAVGDTLVAATSHGFFRQTPTGWEHASRGFARSRVRTMAWGADQKLYTGSSERALSCYDLVTDTWTLLPYLDRFHQALLPPAAGSQLYVATGGEPSLWAVDGSALPRTPEGGRHIRALHRTAAGTLLAFGDQSGAPNTLWRSADEGRTWEARARINVSAFLEVDGAIYAGSHGVYKSADDGQTWTRLDSIRTYVTNFAEHAGTIWATTVSHDRALGSGGVYRSSDAGVSWARITDPLPRMAQYGRTSLTGIVASEGGIFVASARDGVFRSTDEGGTWNAYDAGLPEHTRIRALSLGPDGRLYVALSGWSVFRTVEPVATPSNK